MIDRRGRATVNECVCVGGAHRLFFSRIRRAICSDRGKRCQYYQYDAGVDGRLPASTIYVDRGTQRFLDGGRERSLFLPFNTSGLSGPIKRSKVLGGIAKPPEAGAV